MLSPTNRGRRTVKRLFVALQTLALVASLVVVAPVSAVVNTALQLNGTSQYATLGATGNLQVTQFTLELWFKRVAGGVTQSTGTGGVTAYPLITKGRAEAESAAADVNYFLGIDATGHLAADFEEAQSGAAPSLNHPITGTTVIATDNTWHHAAATYDGTTWNLYLDGVLNGTLSVGRPANNASAAVTAIGSSRNAIAPLTAAGFFAGTIDEVRIWNVARTLGQIQATKDVELTSGQANLVGVWNLNEGTSTVLNDSSGNGMTGAAVGSPTWVPGFVPPPPNSAPVATADSYDTPRDLTFNVAAPGVLTNDTDVDGNPLTAIVNANVTHGTLTLNANGSFAYTPTAGYTGADSFTYHANDGTANSNVVTVSLTVHPPGATALQLNGTTQNATLGTASQLRSATFTLELWFKRTGAGVGTNTGNGGIASAIPLIAKGRAEGETPAQDVNYFFGIDATSGKLVGDFEEAAGGASPSGNHPITGTAVIAADGVWHHAAATYDGTTWNLYLDGSLDGTLSVGQPANAATNVQTSVGTARDTTGTAAGFFAGAVDEVRIWNVARSLAQIQATKNSEITVPTAGLIGRWGLNEGYGSGLADSSGNSILGAAVPSATWVPGFVPPPPPNTAPVAVADSYGTPKNTTLTVPAPGVLGNDSDADGDPLTAIVNVTVTHGSLALAATGAITYVPTAGYTGPDSFTYHANDGTANSTVVTVSLTVDAPGNTAPVAVADSYGTPQNTTLTVAAPGVLANDSDADGDPLTAILDANVSHGSLALGFSGAISYVPTAGYSGPDSFTYHANDGTADSSTVTVSITVGTAPVAVADSYGTLRNTTLNVAAPGVLGNDSDADADPLTAILNTGVAHGTLTLNANGSFGYVPTAGYSGPDSFTYHANDGTANSNVVTVSLTVDTAPVAVADTYSTPQDTTLTVPAPGVLTNDSDADGDPLTAIVDVTVAHGSLALGFSGGFIYTPTTGYSGPDSFTYHANDGTADSTIVTVSLTVTPPPNTAPVAVADSYSTPQDTTLTVSIPGVLGNDSDADGDPLTAILDANVSHGSLALGFSGGFTYVPTAGYSGPDSFTYHANDGTANSTVVTVSLTVDAPGNTAPVAVADSYGTPQNTTLTVAAPGVLANDSDADGDPLTAILDANVSHGSLALGFSGAISYVPTAGYSGPDSFTYHANDGTADSSTVTVSITVGTAPVAVADSYGTLRNTTLNVAAPGVLGNDSDADADPLTAILNTGVAHGTLTLNANGSFGYVPTAGYSGPDSFTYHANDGTANSNVVTVSLTVDTAPVAVADTYSTPQDTTLTVPAPGVLTNDSDADGDPLTAIVDVTVAHGSLALGFSGGFIYTPTTGYSGPDSFTYHANDGTADSTIVTVSLTVTPPPNTAPVAVADSYSTPQDTTLTVSIPGVLGNDSDADGDPLTAILDANVSHGSLALGFSGGFIYTPTTGYSGPDSFTYHANDGTANSTVVTVSLTVTPPPNTAPVATADSYSTPQNVTLTVPAPGVLANDTDANGDPLTAIVNVTVAHGTLTLNASGAISYVPTTGYSGPDSFTYHANDGTANSTVVTVSLTVTPPPNTAPVATADSYSTPQNVTLTVPAPGVLGNDTDANGDPLTAIVNVTVAHGTLTLNASGAISYVPTTGYSGPDSFTYHANDGTADSNIATVSLTVTPPAATALQLSGSSQYATLGATTQLRSPTFTVELWFKRTGAGVGTNTGDLGIANAIPLIAKGRAEAENANADINYFLGIDATSGKLVGDFEEGAGGTQPSLNHPITGTAVIAADGVWHHAAATYDGTTWNLYLDGALDATLSVGRPANAATNVLTSVGSALDTTGTAAGFFAGAVDEVRIWNVARTIGQIQATKNSEITVPTAGLIGRWGLNEGTSTTLNDSSGNSFTGAAVGSPTWVPGFVPPATNTAPVAVADSYSTPQNTALTVAAPGVLANDSDADGNPITAILNVTVGHGSLTLNANGSFTYTPTAVYSGPDSFTYHANDGTANSAIVTVSLTVGTPTNTALQLNGSSQYATLGATTQLRSPTFTVELWFKRTGAGVGTSTGTGGILNAIPLIAKGRAEAETANADINYFLGIDATSGKLVGDFEEAQTGTTPGLNHPVTGTAVIAADGVWHHAAATYDGTTWNLYLDGALDATLAVGQPANAANIVVTSVGSALLTTGTASGFFAGAVDEVRIWNVARTIGQIQATKNSEITVPTAGLIGRWGLNEGTSTTLNDSSGNSFTGAAVGSPTWVPGFVPPATNGAPNAPTLNAPANGGTGIGTSPTLSVGVSDPDANPLTVTYFGRPFASGNFAQIAQHTGVVSGTTDTAPWASLGAGQQFEWYVTVGDGIATTTGPTWTFTTTASADPVFVGAGDIASCAVTEDTATGTLLGGIQGNVFTVGDNVYDFGTPTEFTNCYAPTPWGSPGIKGRTRPIPGNHDWASNNLDGYTGYFGAAATDANGKSYYSYDIPSSNWHIVNLDSECQLVPGGCAAGSAQELWLKADLAANSTKNVIALWHKPRYSSGATNNQLLQPFWADLYAAGADIVLDGHDHIYERFSPMKSGATPADPPVADPTYGIQQFTVGTGGEAHHTLATTLPTSIVRDVTSFGIFKLTLHATTYDWVFLPIAGSTFTDAGSGTVHAAPPATNTAPVAVADSYSTPQNTALTVAAPGVLANDSDADGNPITAILNVTVGHGSLTLNANGSFTYTPTAAYSGPDSFTYHANDGTANSAIVTVSLTVNPPPPPTSLIAYWAMDETSGSVAHDSGAAPANDAATVASPTWVPGRVGNALQFNGTTQYATTPDSNDLDITTAITIAAWVRPEKVGSSNIPQQLVQKASTGGTNGYEIGLTGATSTAPQKAFIRFNEASSGDTFRVTSTTLYPTNGTTWIHIAGTWDGTTIRFYYNGVAQGTPVAFAGPITANTRALSIGGPAPFDASRLFKGALDDVRVYNRALSPAEIAALASPATNGAPNAPTLNAPANGGTGIGTSPTLSVGVSDPDANPLTVTYFGRPFASGNFAQIAQHTGVVSGTTDTAPWASLGAGQQFEWYVTVGDGIATTTGPTWTFTTTASADPVFVGAGDIASCAVTEDTATGTLLGGIQGNVFTVGDNVYDFGTPTEFTNCYAPTPWGSPGIKGRTRPIPGNHDWASNNLDGYTGYFGAAATDANGKSYYSYDIPSSNWHIVNLDSECQLVPGGCAAGSAQELWLKADLAANSTKNVIALWHKPRYSSGATNNQLLQPFWADLYAAGADIVLDGHDHIYERFSPMKSGATPADPPVADPTYGIQQFTVGTGGEAHHTLATTLPTSIVRDVTSFGIFKLTLHATTYDWVFLPIAGSTFTDAGSGTVHAAPPATNTAPVAVADSYSTPQNTALTVAAPGVLANDSDADGNPITAILNVTVGHGSLTLNANGSFTYTPTAAYSGPDSFTYHANDGTANSAIVTVSLTVGTPTNTALQLNGSSQYATLGATTQLRSPTFTVELWFKRTGAGVGTSTGTGGILNAIPLIAKGRAEAETANADINYFLGIDATSGKLVGDFEEAQTGTTPGLNHPVTGTAVIAADGVWHHAAATYDGTTWNLYLDGALDATLAVGQPANAANIVVTSVGSALLTTGTASGFFAGAVDEVRIWNVARSLAQIQATKNSEITVPTAGLIGRWGLNEGTSTTLNDSSGNSFTGAAVGSPTWVPGFVPPATNGAPNAPTLNAPANGGTGIGTSPTLSVGVSDPDANPLTVTYFGRPFASGNFAQIAQHTGVVSGTTDTAPWASLGAGQQFEWYVTVGDGIATTTGPTWTFTTTASADPVFVGAGDIASCAVTEDTATGTLLGGIQGNVFTVGDNVYDFGTPTEFTNCYAPTPWGSPGIKGRTRPIPGNHDWASNNLDGYTGYFGAAATDANGKSYYSYDIPSSNWHIVNLDSECQLVPGGCAAGSAQELWLKADLAANSTKNVIALWHKPRYSSGATNNQLLQPFWADLYAAGADIVLDGHDHIYERFSPMKSGATPADPPVADPTYGIQQFTVGTGGEAHHTLATTLPTSIVRDVTSFGIFKLTLHATTYDWVFLPIAGSTFTDAGSGTVHAAPPATNTAPVAVADSYSTPQNTALTVAAPGVLANDSDADGNPITAILNVTVGHGSLTLNANGSFTYTPTAAYSGPDSFTYHANDGTANSAIVTVSLTVNATNTAPVAVADSYSTPQNTALTVAAPGVLANDSDADGNPITAILNVTVGHGSLTLNANGSFTYTPTAAYSGPDSFTYHANDGTANSAIVTVSLTVNATNTAPVAVADSYSTPQNTALTVAAPGVLANDSDADGNPITAILNVTVGHGSLTLNANGSFTYTPTAAYSGPDSFTYHANDGTANSAIVTVSLTVNATNTAPVAVADSYSTPQNTALTVAAPGVLGNDSDADGNPITAILNVTVGHGSLTLNANGSFTYTPTAAYSGPDSFTYHANDGTANSAIVTVSLTVNATNTAPVAVADSYSTPQNTALTVAAPGVLGNDSDADGNPITAILNVTVGHGSLTLNANGSFTYTPTAAYSGPDSFTYHANDGTANSAIVTVSLTVNATNTAPVAVADSYSTPQNTALTVAAPGVLANDSDADGNPITAILNVTVGHGSLTLNANGSFTYTPTAAYSGPDSFTYHANDGTANSAIVTVSLTVNPPPPPTSLIAYWAMDETSGSVAHDSGAAPANDAATVASPTWVPGRVGNALQFNGTTQYATTPDSNDLDITTAITIAAWVRPEKVGSSNIPQQLVQKASTGGTNGYEIGLTGATSTAPQKAFIRFNEASSGDTFRVTSTTLYPTNGTTWIHIAGTWDGTTIRFYYNGVAQGTPVAFAGPITANTRALSIGGPATFDASRLFKGALDDVRVYNRALSPAEIAALASGATNTAPVAVADSYSTPQNTALTVAAPGVLGNDSDADGNPITAILNVTVGHGSLTLNANGSFTYTPTAAYSGPDSFTYHANDGTANSAIVTVSLTVNATNTAPVAVADSYSTPQNTALTVAAPGVLANDSDADGNPITAILNVTVGHGSLTLNANGSFTYTPTAAYSGPDSFTYHANDGTANSAIVTVSLTVNATNTAPVAVADSYSTPQNTALTVAAPGVLANDSDADGNPITAILNVTVGHGSLTLNANGSFTYTPTAAYSGPDSFTYHANDGTANSAIVTVSLTVNATNTAPVAVADSYSTPQNTALTVAAPGVLGNDSDADGNPITAILNVTVGHGSLTLNANGSFTYTPTAAYSGPDSFTYHANDGTANSAIVTVSLTVNATNTAPVAVADSYSTPQNTALTVAAPGVLANDSDADGNPITAILNVTVGHGSLTLNANGSFTYTPTAAYSGPDSFTYHANDGTANSAIVTVSLTVNPPPPPTSLIAYWAMDETSGSVAHDSGAAPANDAATVASPTWVPGRVGNALQFNGTTQYATTPDSNDLDITTAITIAAWVRPEKVGSSNIPQQLVQKASTGGTNGYEIGLTGATSTAPQKAFIRFNEASSGDTFRVTSTTLYPTNGTTWIHIAGTWDGTTIRFYYNGVAQGTPVAFAGPITANTRALSIGGPATFDASRLFKGALDDVRVYNRALSPAEIANLASGVAIVSPTSPTVTQQMGVVPGTTGTIAWASSGTGQPFESGLVDADVRTARSGLGSRKMGRRRIRRSSSSG